MTWSPSFTWLTWSPTAVTTPVDSWPRTDGRFGLGRCSSWSCEWQTPVAKCRTSTWVGPGSGRSMSSTTSGLPASTKIAAGVFMADRYSYDGPASLNAVQRTGGELVLDSLKAAGVDTAFGIISVHNIPIFDAIAREGGVRVVPARTEHGAASMADGFARSSGRL